MRYLEKWRKNPKEGCLHTTVGSLRPHSFGRLLQRDHHVRTSLAVFFLFTPVASRKRFRFNSYMLASGDRNHKRRTIILLRRAQECTSAKVYVHYYDAAFASSQNGLLILFLIRRVYISLSFLVSIRNS